MTQQTTLKPEAKTRQHLGSLFGIGILLSICMLIAFGLYQWQIRDVSLAEQRWKQSGISSYILDVSLSCPCLQNGHYVIEVQNGKVISATSLPGGYSLASQGLFDMNELTVERALKGVRQEMNQYSFMSTTKQLSVVFDWQYGYVRNFDLEIFTDGNLQYHYTVHSLTPIIPQTTDP